MGHSKTPVMFDQPITRIGAIRIIEQNIALGAKATRYEVACHNLCLGVEK